jgi:hypothetical protein
MGPHPALFFAVIGLLLICLFVIAAVSIARLRRRRIDQTPEQPHHALDQPYQATHATPPSGSGTGSRGAMHKAPPSRPPSIKPPPSGARGETPEGWK